MLTLESFEQASEIVKQVTQETKLIKSSYFSELTGNKVYLKPENMQRTGAYKVRGAYYKISTLSDEERNKGLITASAGNHAQGVAYAAHKYGVKAVIVMPTTTPLHQSLLPDIPRSYFSVPDSPEDYTLPAQKDRLYHYRRYYICCP